MLEADNGEKRDIILQESEAKKRTILTSILGVSPNASDDEIKGRQGAFARKYQSIPDNYSDNPLGFGNRQMKKSTKPMTSVTNDTLRRQRHSWGGGANIIRHGTYEYGARWGRTGNFARGACGDKIGGRSAGLRLFELAVQQDRRWHLS